MTSSVCLQCTFGWVTLVSLNIAMCRALLSRPREWLPNMAPLRGKTFFTIKRISFWICWLHMQEYIIRFFNQNNTEFFWFYQFSQLLVLYSYFTTMYFSFVSNTIYCEWNMASQYPFKQIQIITEGREGLSLLCCPTNPTNPHINTNISYRDAQLRLKPLLVLKVDL